MTIDIAGWTMAWVCESYPHANDRREIHLLRMQLNRYHLRLSEVELERDNYKAAYELQHGPTVDLPLTGVPRQEKQRYRPN